MSSVTSLKNAGFYQKEIGGGHQLIKKRSSKKELGKYLIDPSPEVTSKVNKERLFSSKYEGAAYFLAGKTFKILTRPEAFYLQTQSFLTAEKIEGICYSKEFALFFNDQGDVFCKKPDKEAKKLPSPETTRKKLSRKYSNDFEKNTPKKVVCSQTFGLILYDLGQVFGIGSNSGGALGPDLGRVFKKPVELNLKNSHIRDVACGANHSAFLDTAGRLFILGFDLEGTLLINARGNVSQIASTSEHVITLEGENEVFCGQTQMQKVPLKEKIVEICAAKSLGGALSESGTFYLFDPRDLEITSVTLKEPIEGIEPLGENFLVKMGGEYFEVKQN